MAEAVRTSELVERRERLLAQRGRDDPETVSLTERLRATLAEGTVVRALEPGPTGADRDLAVSLARREPVHPAGDAAELRRRLATDRRVFVAEHPSLPGRPMNVLWVALCRGVPETLAEVLSPEVPVLDPELGDSAVFYSIWNAQGGLAGIGAGTQLVKDAGEQLRSELGGLEVLTTMSPVPGFRTWHERHRTREDLAASCATYLRTIGPDGRLLDPVARFHMGNGARLWRVLPDADPSQRGRDRSFGVMANYRYHPEDIAANLSALSAGHPVVGDQVASLTDST